MSQPAWTQLVGPGTPAYRFALWLNESPRTWLTWMAIGAGVLAGMSIAFAAVWAALLPPWQSATSVWVWGVAAAVFFVISMGLLFINATGHMPGWLAGIFGFGGLATSMGVLMVFFWAVLATNTTSLLAVAAIMTSLVVVIPLTLALMWPMAESMRPWLYRQAGAEHPPGRVGRD